MKEKSKEENMKALSIEEKAKRYDEVIERAAKWINEHTNLSEKLVIEDFKKHMKG